MNVIVIPDASMIVIPLIEKNGHNYLSPSNFSKYDNTDICDGNLKYDKVFSSYMSSEIPSGVRGRLFLLSNVIDKADAAIIIGKRPKHYERLYNPLNDLILFGGNSCNNAHSLAVKMVEDSKIPTLKLAYPINKVKLIKLINKTNKFLRDLTDFSDDLNPDLYVKTEKMDICDVKRILDKLI